MQPYTACGIETRSFASTDSIVFIACSLIPLAVLKRTSFPSNVANELYIACSLIPLAVLKRVIDNPGIQLGRTLHAALYRLRYWNILYTVLRIGEIGDCMQPYTACGIETKLSQGWQREYHSRLHAALYRLRYWNPWVTYGDTFWGHCMQPYTACGIETFYHLLSCNIHIILLHAALYRLRYWNLLPSGLSPLLIF